MAEEACAGNLQAGFCEEGPLHSRGPLLDPGGEIPPDYSPAVRASLSRNIGRINSMLSNLLPVRIRPELRGGWVW